MSYFSIYLIVNECRVNFIHISFDSYDQLPFVLSYFFVTNLVVVPVIGSAVIRLVLSATKGDNNMRFS